MKTNLLVLVLGIVFITSCGEDPELNSISVDNTLTIGENSFAINYGAFVIADLNEDFNTTQVEFALSSDSIILTSAGGFAIAQNPQVDVRFTIFAEGTDGSFGGTYAEGEIGLPSTDVYFIRRVVIGGTTRTVDTGSITLQGNSPDFTVLLDLTLQDGQTLSGGFSGAYLNDEEEDEIPTPTPINNELTYANQSFAIQNGAFRTNTINEANNNTQIDFALANGEILISESGSGFQFQNSADTRVVFSIISEGTSGVSAGTYSLGDVVNPTTGSFFMTLLTLGGTDLTATSGTISVNGTSPTFTVTFNLTINDGETVSGGFAGSFSTQ